LKGGFLKFSEFENSTGQGDGRWVDDRYLKN